MNEIDLLKKLILREEETETLPQGFEEDPMGFILKKYPGLNTVMEYMMTKDFKEFVDAIFVVAPKPTTFKVLLHNGQYFFLQFMGDTYQATVLGKNYYLKSIGEKERCMLAIARLLRYGSPLKTKGPEGGETGTGEEAGGLGGETAPAETGGEEEAGGEALEEKKIIQTLLNRSLISEAYTFFPKSEREIEDPNLRKLFKLLRSISDIEDPIALDPDKPNWVNVTRKLQSDPKTLAALKKLFGQPLTAGTKVNWNGLNIKFGEGSRGGRGVKSKGPAFENTLVGDLQKVSENGFDEEDLSSYSNPEMVQKIVAKLGLQDGGFEVISEGGKNQSRPLQVTSAGPEIVFSGESVASTLTDITVIKDKKPYYISAKFGNTLTFFNSGVTRFLPPDEIKSGMIKNPEGKILLKTLGINNKMFCAVFNDYGKIDFSTVKVRGEVDIAKLQHLVSSGIGSGYYYAKSGGGDNEFFKIDGKYNKLASTITSVPKVYYGGLDGSGKRIDIVFESAKYFFKVNIRNKQGGLYPTHIMCDYKLK